MREEKLESLRNEIKKLRNARKKYLGRNKRIQELSEDPKVKEYIKLQEQNLKENKIIKQLGHGVTVQEAEKIIIGKVFEEGIEKISIEETNGIYIFQGIRPMGERVYYKYHNLEKKLPTFILEEQNEEFVKNNIILDGELSQNTPENQQRFYSEIQADFFRKMYNEGQEEAKKYIKTIHSSIIKK